MTFSPVMSDSKVRCSSPFPSCRTSVLSEDSFHGHMASTTRHGTPLPSHQGGTYLSTRIFTCFQIASLAGAGTSDRSSLHHVDSILWLLVFRPCSSLTHSTTTSLLISLVPILFKICIWTTMSEKSCRCLQWFFGAKGPSPTEFNPFIWHQFLEHILWRTGQ